jgi:hypothetical protein
MNRFCKTAFLIFGLALQGAAGGMALAQSPDPFEDDALTCEEMRKYPEQIFFRKHRPGVRRRLARRGRLWLQGKPGRAPLFATARQPYRCHPRCAAMALPGNHGLCLGEVLCARFVEGRFCPAPLPAGGRGRGGAQTKSRRQAQVFRGVVAAKLLQLSIAPGVPFGVRQSPAETLGALPSEIPLSGSESQGRGPARLGDLHGSSVRGFFVW